MSEKVVRTKVEMRASTYLSTLFVPIEVGGLSWGDEVVVLPAEDYDTLLRYANLWRERRAQHINELHQASFQAGLYHCEEEGD